MIVSNPKFWSLYIIISYTWLCILQLSILLLSQYMCWLRFHFCDKITQPKSTWGRKGLCVLKLIVYHKVRLTNHHQEVVGMPLHTQACTTEKHTHTNCMKSRDEAYLIKPIPPLCCPLRHCYSPVLFHYIWRKAATSTFHSQSRKCRT